MRLLTKRRISQIWGKSEAWCSITSKPGRELADAVVEKRIDVESECYLAFCERKGFLHTKDDKLRKTNKKPTTEPIDDGAPGSIDDVMDLRLRDIVTNFGDEAAFSAWLRDLKTAEEIREKRLKNELAEKAIIAREGVQSQLMGLLEELSRRLLQDGSKTITRRCYSSARSDVAIEQAEKATQKILSQNLKKAKDGIVRRLRKL